MEILQSSLYKTGQESCLPVKYWLLKNGTMHGGKRRETTAVPARWRTCCLQNFGLWSTTYKEDRGQDTMNVTPICSRTSYQKHICPWDKWYVRWGRRWDMCITQGEYMLSTNYCPLMYHTEYWRKSTEWLYRWNAKACDRMIPNSCCKWSSTKMFTSPADRRGKTYPCRGHLTHPQRSNPLIAAKSVQFSCSLSHEGQATIYVKILWTEKCGWYLPTKLHFPFVFTVG
jgi:hypothetical protein